MSLRWCPAYDRARRPLEGCRRRFFTRRASREFERREAPDCGCVAAARVSGSRGRMALAQAPGTSGAFLVVPHVPQFSTRQEWVAPSREWVAFPTRSATTPGGGLRSRGRACPHLRGSAQDLQRPVHGPTPSCVRGQSRAQTTAHTITTPDPHYNHTRPTL